MIFTNKANVAFGVGVILAGAVSGTPSYAFTRFTQPDAAYQAATTLIDISSIPENSSVSSVTDGSLTVNFNNSIVRRQVPGNWATWSSPPASESSTPPVLFSTPTSLELVFSKPVSAFGFELEPTSFASYPVSAQFFSGAILSGSVNLNVVGNAGARLFAASDVASPFTKIGITADPNSKGFAIAQLRYASQQPPASVPGPLPIFGALSAFSVSRRLRRRLKVHQA
jgi:hypothetical protein